MKKLHTLKVVFSLLALLIAPVFANADAPINRVVAQAATPAEKAAVQKLLADFQVAAESMNDKASVASIRDGIKKIEQINVSQCPQAVQTTFKKFVSDLSAHMEKVAKIFDDLNISDDTDIEEAARRCNDPEVKKELERSAQALTTSATAFVHSLISYLMP